MQRQCASGQRTAWHHCHIVWPQTEAWPVSSPPTEASNIRKHSQEPSDQNCSAVPAFAALNPAEEQEKTFCTAFKIPLQKRVGRITKQTVTAHFFAVHITSPLFPHPAIPLGQRRLKDYQQKAWLHPMVLEHQSLEEKPVISVPYVAVHTGRWRWK